MAVLLNLIQFAKWFLSFLNFKKIDKALTFFFKYLFVLILMVASDFRSLSLSVFQANVEPKLTLLWLMWSVVYQGLFARFASDAIGGFADQFRFYLFCLAISQSCNILSYQINQYSTRLG